MAAWGTTYADATARSNENQLEVNTACWSSTPAIKQWLDQRGFSPDDGYAYFVKKAADLALARGRRPVQWVAAF